MELTVSVPSVAGQEQAHQVALLRKSNDMNKQMASELMNSLPQMRLDTSAPRGQQVRIQA